MLDDLARELVAKIDGEKRFLLGITGIPAAGKSTFATALVARVNEMAGSALAIVVPMDGFHLPNAVIKPLGLHALKGIPETFDAAGFLACVENLRADAGMVNCPAFERALDDPVPNVIHVQSSHRLLVIEGNYLLLQRPVWRELQAYLDAVWYLEAPDKMSIEARLLERHIAGGRTVAEAQAKIASTDTPNAALIEATRHLADRVIGVGELS